MTVRGVGGGGEVGRGLGYGAGLAIGVVGVAGGAGDWTRGDPRGRVISVGVGCFGRGVQRRGRAREAAEVVVGKGEVLSLTGGVDQLRGTGLLALVRKSKPVTCFPRFSISFRNSFKH